MTTIAKSKNPLTHKINQIALFDALNAALKEAGIGLCAKDLVRVSFRRGASFGRGSFTIGERIPLNGRAKWKSLKVDRLYGGDAYNSAPGYTLEGERLELAITFTLKIAAEVKADDDRKAEAVKAHNERTFAARAKLKEAGITEQDLRAAGVSVSYGQAWTRLRLDFDILTPEGLDDLEFHLAYLETLKAHRLARLKA